MSVQYNREGIEATCISVGSHNRLYNDTAIYNGDENMWSRMGGHGFYAKANGL